MRTTLTNLLSAFLVVFALSTAGCYTHEHVIGNGAQTGVEQEARQWYVLWGLIPINNVDTEAMAGGAEDYTIKSERSFLDVVIGIFTGYITVYSQTVTVTK